ncbi:MAG: type II secretion system protein [Candidatus Omnitrophica bacterium]|nr:type II secretion system protein [Candidatus Omnitrophota bacterium]
MKGTNRGISLIELLVVILSLAIVGSMAFQFLWESNTRVARNLSQAAKADRLRLLQKSVDQDLSSVYPNPLEAGVLVGSSTDQETGRTMIETRILESDPNAEPALYQVKYRLQEYPEGSGRTALVRALDPDLAEGDSEETKVKPVFTLDVQESLDWKVETTDWRGATSPSKLQLTLTNSRFKDFQSRREILLHGVRMK